MDKENKYEQLRQKAEMLLKQKGIEKSDNYYGDIEKLVEELNIHQIELEMQNQELQEANQKLVNEQNRYKELYLNAPVAYFTLNQTGNIIELNQAAADLLKIPVQAFRYTSIFPYLDETSKKDFSLFFKKIFRSKKTEYGEIVFKDNNRNQIFATLSAVVYFDNQLNEDLVRLTVIDLSIIKQFENQVDTLKKLVDSENRNRALFDKIGVPILLINPETGQIEDANPTSGKFYGYSIEKLKTMNIAEINQLSESEVKAEMENTRKSGKEYFNFKHKLANGKTRDVEVYSTAISIDQTDLLYSIIHDITDRKNAEKNIKEINAELSNTIEELNTANEELNTANVELNAINDELNTANLTVEREREQFLSILDSIPQIIYVAELDTGKILFTNRKLKEIIGRDIIGEKCFEAIQGKKETCDFCTNKYIRDNDQPYIWNYYNPILDKHFYIMDRKIRWTDNKEVRFELAIDVTEQKKAEQALKESAKKIKDKNTEIALNNERLESLLRVSQFPTNSIQELLDFALNEAIKLTESKIGYIYYYNEENRQFILNSWSKGVMEECKVVEPQTIYDLDKTGIWGEAVRQKRPILINDFQAENPLKKGTPKGHVALKKFLTIPVIIDGKIVAVTAVANKEKNYDNSDIRQLTLLMDSVWKISERLLLIKDLKTAEENLRKREEIHSIAFESANIGIMNVGKSGEILYANEECTHIFGYSKPEFKTMTVNDMTVPEDKNVSPRFIKSALKDNTHEKAVFVKKYFHKKGNIITCEISSTLLHDTNNEPLYFISHVKDITKEKQAEEKLRKSEEKYRLIAENASDVIWILNITKKRFTYISPSVYNLRGFTAEEAMKQDINQSLTPESAKKVIESIGEILPQFLANPTEESKRIHRHELRQPCKDGSIIWIETTTRYQFNVKNEVEVIGISRNIDERKKYEERIKRNSERLNDLLALSQQNINDKHQVFDCALNTALKITQSKYGFVHHYNEPEQRFYLNSWSDSVLPDCKVIKKQTVYNLKDTGLWGEVVRQRKPIMVNDLSKPNPLQKGFPAGHVEIKRFLSVPFISDNKIVAIVAVANKTNAYSSDDILQLNLLMETVWNIYNKKETETKIFKLNNELKEALQTKEVLLKEVHHRVKNNLQTISSLLYQQQTLSNDPKIAEALRDSMNRVSTMALIHQFIYKSPDLKNINMKNYINDLVGKLANTYNQSRKGIIINTEIEEIYFDIEKTIPVALIINEVLSNIFKYAFTGKENGIVNVRLTKVDNEKNKLVISDNGIGLPEDFKPEKSKSLGMYLIKNFAKRQLKGTLQITSKPNEGVKYEIEF